MFSFPIYQKLLYVSRQITVIGE